MNRSLEEVTLCINFKLHTILNKCRELNDTDTVRRLNNLKNTLLISCRLRNLVNTVNYNSIFARNEYNEYTNTIISYFMHDYNIQFAIEYETLLTNMLRGMDVNSDLNL